MSDRKGKLNSLRAASCLMLVSFHCYMHIFGPFTLTLLFYAAGFAAVYDLFDDPEYPKDMRGRFAFSFKRIKKIYPLYVITILIILACQTVIGRGQIGPEERSFLAKAMLSQLLMIQSWLPKAGYATSLNGAAWIFSDLAFMYMALPFIMACMKKYRGRADALKVMALIALLMTAGLMLFTRAYYSRYQMDYSERMNFLTYLIKYFPLYRLGDFLMGCNLAYLVIKRGEKKAEPVKGTALEVLALAAAVLFNYGFVEWTVPEELVGSGMWILPCCLLVYVFALNAGYITRLLDNKAVNLIANINVELYLLHYVVIFIVTVGIDMLPALSEQVEKLLWLAAVLPLCFLLSWFYSKNWGQLKAGEEWV